MNRRATTWIAVILVVVLLLPQSFGRPVAAEEAEPAEKPTESDREAEDGEDELGSILKELEDIQKSIGNIAERLTAIASEGGEEEGPAEGTKGAKEEPEGKEDADTERSGREEKSDDQDDAPVAPRKTKKKKVVEEETETSSSGESDSATEELAGRKLASIGDIKARIQPSHNIRRTLPENPPGRPAARSNRTGAGPRRRMLADRMHPRMMPTVEQQVSQTLDPSQSSQDQESEAVKSQDQESEAVKSQRPSFSDTFARHADKFPPEDSGDTTTDSPIVSSRLQELDSPASHRRLLALRRDLRHGRESTAGKTRHHRA